MEDYRSRSYNDGGMQLEVYGDRAGPPASTLYDYRSYSTTSYSYGGYGSKSIKEKVAAPPPSSSSSSKKGGWVFSSDPDFQRRKRVAGYKAYAVEGRVKGSFRRSFRWLKDRYTQILYGWW
ncbi:hypothetical protein Cni_G29199 [Canna indica]|uniref:DUF3511 domain protein n=1 Tax=Canna indica TaxID=4628 RepID=A0AAQ3L4Q8_9LILI|nr:hypothetical protein Cni_G29199 [Canna indica]